MTATFVHVQVRPEFIPRFIEATRLNHEHSIKEPGNLRFDILQDAADPSRFVLYEAYKSDEDAAAHEATAHYLNWKDTVAPWMASPRQGVKHHLLFPVSK